MREAGWGRREAAVLQLNPGLWCAASVILVCIWDWHHAWGRVWADVGMLVSWLLYSR
jgi:hypothetical protein